jgi:hypothetical protein
MRSLSRKFMQGVRGSTIKIKATEFPFFLYPADAAYNPHKPLIGLLRGPLLVRVSELFSHIFVKL